MSKNQEKEGEGIRTGEDLGRSLTATSLSFERNSVGRNAKNNTTQVSDYERASVTFQPKSHLSGLPLGPVSRMSLIVFAPESRSKISNLLTTSLFYLHILNMTRSSLRTRRFQACTPFCFQIQIN